MEFRKFGTISDSVSLLGFGAGHVGRDDFSEAEAGRLLNAVLDSGINLIDTARGYGLSEERIGRHLKSRRGEFILITKGGYGVDGATDWTPKAIEGSLNESLKRMNTDYVDLFYLHSCSLEDLGREENLEALDQMKASGKCRAIGYSGENEELEWAIASDRFDAIETSINICDQAGFYGHLSDAAMKGMGIIAKRPLANVFWQFSERPAGMYAEEYWLRWEKMSALNINGFPESSDAGKMIDWAWSFTASVTEVSSAIIGTSKPENLAANISRASAPLPGDLVHRRHLLRSAWEQASLGNWRGQI